MAIEHLDVQEVGELAQLHLGENVRLLLVLRRKRIQDLADRLSLSASGMSRRLAGLTDWSVKEMARCAQALGVTVAQLLSDPAELFGSVPPGQDLPRSLYVAAENVIKLFPDVEPCDMQLASGQ